MSLFPPWRGDAGDFAGLLRRIARNMAFLLSGQAAAALLGLASLSVAAHALGAAGLGVLVLIEVFIRTVGLVTNLEPWQAVMRYGTLAIEEKREEDFHQLLKAGTLFDLTAGCLAAVASISLALLVGGRFLGAEHVPMAVVFSLGLPFSMGSTAQALLRMQDRFRTLASLAVGLAVLRLSLSILAWAVGGGVWGFLLVSTAMLAADGLGAFALAWSGVDRAFRRAVIRAPVAGVRRRNPGILRFIWNANLNVVARNITQRLDVLILGAMVPLSEVGLFVVAKRLANATMLIARPLQQAILPEFARLSAQRAFVVMRRTVFAFMAATFGTALLVLVLVLPWLGSIVVLLFGPGFAGAAPQIAVQLVAVAFLLSGMILNPALLNLGRDRSLVRITLAVSFLCIAAIWIFVALFGAIGASVAYVLSNALWSGLGLSVFLKATTPTQVDVLRE